MDLLAKGTRREDSGPAGNLAAYLPRRAVGPR
ncbi:hypothetical protein SAMN05660976_02884 [Nonomuraea pusilla]|uniref:Uncharacterized protein n=1 Tax=Nonomuraea pusilla TaxID=46177 RepID=A0A1H7RCW1_9ACTN|nr:hypothetical protein SAMN05660976_02884 [Nonomuraea pusilla]